MRHKPRTRSRVMAADQGVDIVGDVHACYDEFIELLQRLGYERCHDGTHRHPEGRKLLSLGDITSRGPQSIKMLQFSSGMWQRAWRRWWTATTGGKLPAGWMDALSCWRTVTRR